MPRHRYAKGVRERMVSPKLAGLPFGVEDRTFRGGEGLRQDGSFSHDDRWVIVHSFPQRAIETGVLVHVDQEPRRGRFRRSDDEVEELFDELRTTWAAELGASSSLDERFMSAVHQRIIGLGPQVLPHIIEDLRETGDLWFWALIALVGEDKAAGAETVDDAAKRWILWAEQEGYVA